MTTKSTNTKQQTIITATSHENKECKYGQKKKSKLVKNKRKFKQAMGEI